MNKLIMLAIGGFQVLILTAAVHGAEPAQDPWQGWQPIELPDNHQHLIEQESINAMKNSIDHAESNRRSLKNQMPSSFETASSPLDLGKDSTHQENPQRASNHMSESRVVSIPENANYEEWVGALVEAYPDLEKDFSGIEAHKEAQKRDRDEFNAQFDREWQALVSDSRPEPEELDIPEGATFEEIKQLLQDNRPELKDEFDQMDEIRKEHEKMREEFLKNFEKEWSDTEMPTFDKLQFNKPLTSTL